MGIPRTNHAGAPAFSSLLICLDDVLAFGQIIDRGEGRAHLARIIVNPAKRRLGYGRRIVEELMDLAKSRGYGLMSLNVRRDNLAAKALYVRLGFDLRPAPVGFFIAPNADYMVRKLTHVAADRDG